MIYSLVWRTKNDGFIFDERYIAFSKKPSVLNITEQGGITTSQEHDHGFGFDPDTAGINLYISEDIEHENGSDSEDH